MSPPPLDAMHSSPLRKTKTLSKGAACVTCKQRKVRCDALKPGCTACRRSARWRGEDPDQVQCCYVERTSRRKGSNSHHVDLLRHASRERSSSSEPPSAEEPVQQAPSTPPSPLGSPHTQLPAFPIPSIPAITSATYAPSFVLPELPSLVPLSTPADTRFTCSTLPSDCVMSPMDTLFGPDAPAVESAAAPWTPSLYSADLLAQMDAIAPSYASPSSSERAASLFALLPSYGDGTAFVASPAPALFAWPDANLDFDLAAAGCPPLSPSSSSSSLSSLHSSFSLTKDLGYALAASVSLAAGAAFSPPPLLPPPPPPAALPTRKLVSAAIAGAGARHRQGEEASAAVVDAADPFAAAFGAALDPHAHARLAVGMQQYTAAY
ncbi:hypothetical protein JCM3770_000456 [Rhodotorula araucariae]